MSIIKHIKEKLEERELKRAISNHIYLDNNGNEFVYLGQAFLYDDKIHTAGFVNISDEMKHVYINKNILDNTCSLYDNVLKLMNIYYDGNSFNIKNLFYAEKPLKLTDVGFYDDEIIKGDISIDTFHMVFDFHNYVYNYFNK